MKLARGFTMIELMMTLAIMAVLVMVATPLAQIALQRHKEHELRSALIQIREAIDAYKHAADQGQITLEAGASGYPPSLHILVQGVDDQRSLTPKKIYFLRRVPPDPMMQDTPEAVTNPAASWAPRSYASPPDAPAEGADVFDIYSRSNKVGLNGVPYWEW